MPWRLTDDIDAYADKVWDVLAADPTENTVALTVIEQVRAGRSWSEQPNLFGWYDADGVSGAVSWTPPYGLLLAVVPTVAVDELVAQLRARGAALPGVNGVPVIADAFARAWTAGSPLQATTEMRSRLYVLDALRTPEPAPPGRPRAAISADLDVAVAWWVAFQGETHGPAVDGAQVVRDRVEHGLLWLWEDPAGTVVSLAGRNRAAAGVARIGPVYTPPEHRRRGYGAAVTAACTAAALQQDAKQVVLFTDLANPTSNAIYQRIGYVPVRDQHVVRFTE